MLPLVVRLLLDAQGEFVRAADAVPEAARDSGSGRFNAPGWVVAHAAFFHDVWLNVDSRDLELEACDAWLLDWWQRQGASGDEPVAASFAEARAALGRVAQKTTPILEAMAERELERVPARIEENGWPGGTTVGYLAARSVAHLFAHASELNLLATAAGAPDMGLPGRLGATFGR